MYKRLRNRLLMEIDLAQWRRQTSFWRGIKAPPADKTILFCDLFSGILQAKVQTIFAKALQRKGYSCAVLTQNPISINERIYGTAGNCRFFHFRDYITEEIRRAAKCQAEEMLATYSDFASFFAQEVDGVRIGRNVLSTVARRMRVGSIRFDNPEHKKAIRQILIESFVARDVSERIVDDVGPDVVVFCERGYTPAGEFFDTCISREIDTAQWVGAPQPDTLLFKRYNAGNRGNHPLSLSNDTWEWLRNITWTNDLDNTVIKRLKSHYASGAWFNRQQLQTGKSVRTPEEVRNLLRLDPAKKTAVIFCHILYDATFFFGDSLFADYQTWLVETVRAAIDNPNLNWVVKVHPVNVWKSKTEGVPMRQLEVEALEETLGKLPDHVRIMPADTDINTFSLFDTVDYGLTVRGTIGMELPCFGIPVVTAGSGRYSGRGFTIDPKTPEEYLTILDHLHKIPRLSLKEIEAARKYAYGTFFLRPHPISSFKLSYNAKTYGVPQLSDNVFIDNIDFDLNNDLSKFEEWILNGANEDFICHKINS